MTLENLAPWIAIAFTLALSILVPLFTQIANNKHQQKMQNQRFVYEERKKKSVVYENFLVSVGAAIAYGSDQNITAAGSSIQQIYIYAPLEWWEDLDRLFDYIRKYNWGDATEVLKKLNRLISQELKGEKR